MPQALLIYNPAAGRIPPEYLAKQAAKTFRDLDWEVEVEPTKDAQHITELAREAAISNMDALFLAGGDGSISKAIPGLIGSTTALGILPTGTANVWALEIGLPRLKITNPHAIVNCAKLLANGYIKGVDVGLCNGSPFLLWAGIGLDAVVVNQLEARRRRWKKYFVVVEYAISVLQHILTWPGVNLRIEIFDFQQSNMKNINSHQIEGQFILSLVSNIRYYAGGYVKISPNAYLDDGLMDLWLFPGSKFQVLKHVWKIFMGKHIQEDDIKYFPFNYVSIKSHNPVYFQLDGEPQIRESDFQIKVSPSKLRIIIPSTS